MVQHIHPKFLEDEKAYEAVEEFWKSLIQRLEMELGQQGEWPRWGPRVHPNGKPVDRDGNPIADGKNDALQRAFRIMQHPPDGDALGIGAWTKVYGPDYEPFPHDELMISLSLSTESAAIAEALLRVWMVQGTTPERMEALIDEIVPRPNAGTIA